MEVGVQWRPLEKFKSSAIEVDKRRISGDYPIRLKECNQIS